MNEVVDLVQAKKDASQVESPRLYSIVCHADMSRAGDAVVNAVLLHIIRRHLGVPVMVAMLRVRQAVTRGRAVVKKDLTKEVAETLLSEAHGCAHSKHDNAFDFKTEAQ